MAKQTLAQKRYDKQHTGKVICKYNLSRDIYTAPWQDDPYLGLLYFLQSYGSVGQPLGFLQFENLTCWGERSLKNIMHHYILRSCLRDEIRKFGLPKNRTWLLESKAYNDLDLLTLANIVDETHYAYNYRQNRPERKIHKLLEELYQFEWLYTGDRRPEHKIGTLYPDFVEKKLKLIIEHFGDHCHVKEEIPIKKQIYYNEGYKLLVIWEHELKNMRKVREKIIKFVEDNRALQDIQRMAL